MGLSVFDGYFTVRGLVDCNLVGILGKFAENNLFRFEQSGVRIELSRPISFELIDAGPSLANHL